MNANDLLSKLHRSPEEARYLYRWVVMNVGKQFPQAPQIEFAIVPDNVRASGGRNFLARCVGVKGRVRIEVKESVVQKMPDNEFMDLMRHELAHAYVRMHGMGRGHDQQWEKVFRAFGGSGQRSVHCSD